MKRFVYFLIFYILFLLGFSSVSAEKINRFYIDDYSSVDFLLQYDTELKKYELGVPLASYDRENGNKEHVNYLGYNFELGTYSHGTSSLGIYSYKFFINEEPVKSITNSEALEIYMCKYTKPGVSQYNSGTTYVYIFSDTLQKESKKDSIEHPLNDCRYLIAYEAKNGSVTSVKECKYYEKYVLEIDENFQNYENIDSRAKANKNINSLKQLCKTISEYVDYGEYCLSQCLGFSKWLNETKEKYGIESTDGNGSCGFSGKLINFIANIIKWLKYIIPVVVIVLGILDFIKAISSGKDDEIKKSQGKFVKRLISAALIFLAPIIIEFVLKIFGFDANGCGIIDL